MTVSHIIDGHMMPIDENDKKCFKRFKPEITRTDMKLSYAKTPCLLDIKLSEQSELLKTLRCEAYTEFTQWKRKKKLHTGIKKHHSVIVLWMWSHPPEHIYPHPCEFDLIFSSTSSVGLAPHMERQQGPCTHGLFEIRLVISRHPNIFSNE